MKVLPGLFDEAIMDIMSNWVTVIFVTGTATALGL
jgi:hypothetical protein